MQDRALYSIQEARKLPGGISRNTIYRLLRTGELASVVIGCRRFISPAAIAELIAKSTTTINPSLLASTRSRLTGQTALPLPLPYHPSGPDSADSELIPCMVCVRLEPGSCEVDSARIRLAVQGARGLAR